MPIQNFNFSHFLEYCDVINNAHGSNNNCRHVIIKEQHLLKEHSVTDVLFKQGEIERFSGRILRMCTPKMHTTKPFSMFISEPFNHPVQIPLQCTIR